MKTILVTGARGFVGRNLGVNLRRRTGLRLIEVDVESALETLEEGLHKADLIFHLAGTNRPERVEDYTTGNLDFTRHICERLRDFGKAPKIVFSSSVQAELNNPYGVSKRAAEEVLKAFVQVTGGECIIYRLKNLFGKWCRPNYNSVTATFCHNIAQDLPIRISDPAQEIDLTYIDDVVSAFMGELDAASQPGLRFADQIPSRRISLGELAKIIEGFRAQQQTLLLPDFSDPFIRALYATYLSYLRPDQFSYGLERKGDERGILAEIVKSPSFGQIFISRTKPGITRGNHFHQTKTEKFIVVDGEAAIRLRPIEGGDVINIRVRGDECRVVDIPPGYTHSITNVGPGELVTLFWASEIFDPERPDTAFEEVVKK